MKSLELTKPITTESLLKEFESRFNQTMDLSQFTKEELEDYANHVRTKIHEITQNTHFGRELKDDKYQKNQMMLDIVNQAIKEYGSGEMKSDPKTKALVKKIQAAPGIQDKDQLTEDVYWDRLDVANRLADECKSSIQQIFNDTFGA